MPADTRDNPDDNLDTCDVCGQQLPPQTEPVTADGWYQGRQYAVHARWGAILLRQRCDQHPCRGEGEIR